MITSDDIKKMLDAFMPVFATKLDLENLREEMATKGQFDQVMTRIDGVMGELKTVREEQSAHQLQHDDIKRDLDAIKAVATVAHDLRK